MSNYSAKENGCPFPLFLSIDVGTYASYVAISSLWCEYLYSVFVDLL